MTVQKNPARAVLWASLVLLIHSLSSGPAAAAPITTTGWEEDKDGFTWKFTWDTTAFDGERRPDDRADKCRKDGPDCWRPRVKRVKEGTDTFFTWTFFGQHLIEADREDGPTGNLLERTALADSLARTPDVDSFPEFFGVNVRHNTIGDVGAHEDRYSVFYRRLLTGGPVDFIFKGIHSGAVKAPEPSVLLMLGAGLVAATTRARRILKRRR